MRERIILILIIITLSQCKENKIKKEINIKENLEETKKVKVVEYKENEKIFELFADEIISREEFLRAKGLSISIYEDGLKTLFIRADSGDYNTTSGDIEIKGNVKLWNSEGDTLWTQHLVYKYKEGIIKSDADCRLFQKGKYIKGKGFESKKPFKKIRIFGKIKGEKEK